MRTLTRIAIPSFLVTAIGCGAPEASPTVENATPPASEASDVGLYDPQGHMIPPSAEELAAFQYPSQADSIRVAVELQAAVDSAGEANVTVSTTAVLANGDDVAIAFGAIDWAWKDDGPCTRFALCMKYVNDVGITWGDGSFMPSFGVWRGPRSAHSCIQNAKDDVNAGQRGRAVEWVMASQIHNPPVKEWLRTHPDAVIAALAQIH